MICNYVHYIMYTKFVCDDVFQAPDSIYPRRVVNSAKARKTRACLYLLELSLIRFLTKGDPRRTPRPQLYQSWDYAEKTKKKKH